MPIPRLPSHPLTLIPDVVVGRAGEDPLLAEVVRPSDRSAPAPAVIWLHGGGFRGSLRDGGHKGGLQYWCPFLAANGFVAIGADYRSGPDARFPAQLNDVKTTIRWLRASAADYGVDGRAIGVAGFSAGAVLGALAGLTADTAELEGDGGWAGHSSRVQAVAVGSAPLDFRSVPARLAAPDAEAIYRRDPTPAIGDDALTTAPRGTGAIERMFSGSASERERLMTLASAVSHVRAGAPPYLIAQGTRDEIADFAATTRFVGDMRRHGNEVELVAIEGGYHTWDPEPGHAYPHVAYWSFGPMLVRFFGKHLQRGGTDS